MRGADRNAVWYGAERVIEAPVDLVWDVQTNVAGWRDWNPSVGEVAFDGPFGLGAACRWKSGSEVFRFKVTEIDRLRCIVWTGRALWAHAIYAWAFQPAPEGTLAKAEESLAGVLPTLLPVHAGSVLRKSLEPWLDALKRECELRLEGRRDGVPR